MREGSLQGIRTKAEVIQALGAKSCVQKLVEVNKKIRMLSSFTESLVTCFIAVFLYVGNNLKKKKNTHSKDLIAS